MYIYIYMFRQNPKLWLWMFDYISREVFHDFHHTPRFSRVGFALSSHKKLLVILENIYDHEFLQIIPHQLGLGFPLSFPLIIFCFNVSLPTIHPNLAASKLLSSFRGPLLQPTQPPSKKCRSDHQLVGLGVLILFLRGLAIFCMCGIQHHQVMLGKS